MAFVHSPKISTDGLVLCLDAANIKSYAGSGTTWTDLSGNGNTGTLTNATYSNSTISFDGTGDYVTINGNATMPTASHTIEFVYYNNSGTETYPTLYNRVGQSTANGFWWVYTYSGVNTTLYWQYSKTDNTITTLSVSNATTTGAYVHGVITVDYTGYLFKYYKNSQLLSSQALSNTIRTVTTSNTTYIGTYQGISSGYSLQGNIGLFKIYNRVLSSDEILQNFNATRGRFGI